MTAHDDPVFELLRNKDTDQTMLTVLNDDGSQTLFQRGYYIFRAMCVAKALKSNNVGEGNFVAIVPLNLPESFWGLLGIMLVGAIPVPIHPIFLKEADLSDVLEVLNDCKPKLLIANEQIAEFLKGLAFKSITELVDLGAMQFTNELRGKKYSELDFYEDGNSIRSNCFDFVYRKKNPADILIMPYTSGTHKMKGVMLSQQNIMDRVLAVGKELDITDNDRLFSFLPLAHISALIADFLCQLVFGYQVFFIKEAELIIKDRTQFKKAVKHGIGRSRPTIFLNVPLGWANIKKEIEKAVPIGILRRFLRRLIRRGAGLDKVRHFISAASILHSKDLMFFDRIGIRIRDIYGLTEVAGPLTIDGRLIGDGSTKVSIDPDSGEILIGGPCVMNGYFDQTANDKAFTTIINGTRFYRTGDLADRYFYAQTSLIKYAGRIGDTIKLANGEKVSQVQIDNLEEKIKKIDPEIIEVIVCGDGLPQLFAMVFTDQKKYKYEKNSEFTKKLTKGIATLGQGGGMLKIGGWELIDTIQLEYTPTMKLKRGNIIRKFKNLSFP